MTEIMIGLVILAVVTGSATLPQMVARLAVRLGAPRVRTELVLRRRGRWSAGDSLLVTAVVGLGAAALWLSFG